jgi:hypothetical protein
MGFKRSIYYTAYHRMGTLILNCAPRPAMRRPRHVILGMAQRSEESRPEVGAKQQCEMLLPRGGIRMTYPERPHL